ncbi:MAG: hypothetical protein QOJ42_8157, partial [Acidobacteriaceae bacterium]|nr:hypothetical protein [Acidobacteriaceae bacterium]
VHTQYFIAQPHDVEAAAYVENALLPTAFCSFLLHQARLPARRRISLQRSIYFTAPALALMLFGSPMVVTSISSLR